MAVSFGCAPDRLLDEYRSVFPDEDTSPAFKCGLETNEQWMKRINRVIEEANECLFYGSMDLNSSQRVSQFLKGNAFIIPPKASRIPAQVLEDLEKRADEIEHICARKARVPYIPIHFKNLKTVDITGAKGIKNFSGPIHPDLLLWRIGISDSESPHLRAPIWPKSCDNLDNIEIISD